MSHTGQSTTSTVTLKNSPPAIITKNTTPIIIDELLLDAAFWTTTCVTVFSLTGVSDSKDAPQLEQNFASTLFSFPHLLQYGNEIPKIQYTSEYYKDFIPTNETIQIDWTVFQTPKWAAIQQERSQLVERSVSCSDLIKTKHNSNQIIQQITLTGEPVDFFVFTFVGIVPCTTIKLTKHQQEGRFIELTNCQIESVYDFIKEKKDL